MKKGFLSFTVFLIGCQTAPTNLEPNWFQSSWQFESPEKTYSHAWSNDPAGNSKVIRFEIRNGEAWDNDSRKSFRSEVSTNYFPKLNSLCIYDFDIYLPADFPIENNRLVLAQWWAKTKKHLGEVARSPSVALRFVNGKFYVTIRHSDKRVITQPDAVSETQIYKNNNWKLGAWTHFNLKVFWSYKETGRVVLKINNNEVANYAGPVGYNDDQAPQFRFGIYRDDSPKTYVAYFRDVKISCE